jgi:hypothetical protein
MAATPPVARCADRSLPRPNHAKTSTVAAGLRVGFALACTGALALLNLSRPMAGAAHTGQQGASYVFPIDRGADRVTITIAPNEVGWLNTIVVTTGRENSHLDIRASFSMVEMEMGTQTCVFARRAGGGYVCMTHAFLMPGTWRIAITIRSSHATFRTTILDRIHLV